MLENIIPNANVRKPIYQIFAAIGLLLGAIQVGFSTAEIGQPVWLTVAMGVYAFLAGVGFTVSQANTVTPTATIEGIDLSEPSAKHAKLD